MNKLCRFRDDIENESFCWGILNEDTQMITCLCCGATVEMEDVVEIEYVDWINISSILEEW